MSEMEVPKGWKIVNLSDKEYFLDIIGGGTPPRGNSEYFGGEIPWVRLKDMKQKYISDTNEKLTVKGLQKGSRKIPKNAVILSTRATIGKVAIAKTELCTNQGFKSIVCNNEKIMPEFLYYFLLSIKSKLQKLGGFTTFAEINKTKLSDISVFIPPIQIQKKIVAKLDHILGELEVKTKEILKLKEKKESGMSILSQKTIGEMILNHMKIDDIPKTWQIKTLEDCVDIQAGFAQGEKNVANGTIHLRMNNIGRNFELNYDLTRTINATKEQLIKYKLEKDDVIFNNTNSPELVGKSFIFNDDKVCLYSNHLTRCRVNKELLLPNWLLFYIRGKWLRRDFENMCNKWINQAAFGGNKLKKLKIPIPPLDEQKQILKILMNTSIQFEHISNIVKIIKNRDEQNEEFINYIQSSILDSAFSGKLVN
jgi:type I restriction enzyme, S subunit